jgi:hypothetical protein
MTKRPDVRFALYLQGFHATLCNEKVVGGTGLEPVTFWV